MNTTAWLRGMAVAFVLALLAGALAPGEGPPENEVAKLIRQLGDDDFAKRDAASKRLAEIGEPALDALDTARKSEDAEVRRRAVELIDAIWQREYREIACYRGHVNTVWQAIPSPDGKYIVSAGHDHTLRLWDVATGKMVRIFEGHTDRVLSIAFSPNGKQLVSGGGDQQLLVWDVATGEELWRLPTAIGTIKSVAWVRAGYLLTLADGWACLWDAESGKRRGEFGKITEPIECLAANPDGKTFAVLTHDGSLSIWSLETKQFVRVFAESQLTESALCFSPDGKKLLSAETGGTIRLWDVSTGEQLGTLVASKRSVCSLAFSPDGRRALSGGEDQTVRLWDVETGRETHCLKGHTHFVTSVAFFPDGRRVVSASVDDTVRIWALPK